MGARRPNPRLAKIHRNYTVEEAAAALRVHKNTVRQWVKSGLPTIDDRRPVLILGLVLQNFLQERRKKAKQVCGPGKLYCVKCRRPKRPAFNAVDYIALSDTSGNLQGICPECETLIHRRVSRARLEAVAADLDVAFPEALQRIGESARPSLNCDSIMQ